MRRERGTGLSRLLLYGVGLLCLCVMIFVLGSTLTFWTMQFAFDDAGNPVLEGSSLPTVVSNIVPAMPARASGEPSAGPATDVDKHGLLRPPNLAV